jgi:hypothetical protein
MKFILGERKEVSIRVSSKKTDPFVIRNPRFSLVKSVTGSEVAAGTCTLMDKEISALIEPLSVGGHTLIFMYEIGNELLKASVSIQVAKD